MLIREMRGPVAFLTLNRPDVGNAIDSSMESELSDALAQLVEDDSIRVIVFRGAGDRAFSVGHGIGELSGGSLESPAESVLPNGKHYWQIMQDTNKVLVAAIKGKCLGQGLELALACDIRVAAEDAEFGFPEVSTGTIPSTGGTQLLPRTIAKGQALEMILTSQTIDAAEAYRIGLVNKMVKSEELTVAVEKLLETLISMAPLALKYAKEAIIKGLDLTLEQGMRLEADLSALLQTTEDRKEGIRAFLEKRPPRFVGR